MANNLRLGDQKGSKATIMQTLRIKGPLSRIDLTNLTGLSRATVSLAISELIEADLVHETTMRHSTGGRPATSLTLTSQSRVIFGAVFDNQEWALGAFDLLGNVLDTVKIPVGTSSPEAVVSALCEELYPFAMQFKIEPLQILGLGMPGLVDTERGIIHSAADLGWRDVKIVEMINEKAGWPAVIVNRHKARGLAECRYGSGQPYNQMIYIGIGSGIAAGIFMDRELVSGFIGGAGELGHVTIDPDGPLCLCGNHGCLQLLSAGPAIELEARKRLRTGQSSLLGLDPHNDLLLVTAKDICKAAEQNDALCVQVLEQAATYLGIAMANLVNLLNPEAVILGGSIPRNSPLYVKTAAHVMNQRAMRPLAAKVEVKQAAITEFGGALGAANFALDKNMSFSLFTDNNEWLRAK